MVKGCAFHDYVICEGGAQHFVFSKTRLVVGFRGNQFTLLFRRFLFLLSILLFIYFFNFTI